MPPKTAIMDASSAIILCKTNLHHLLTGMYDIILPDPVFREITDNQYADAEEYKRLAAERKIRIKKSASRREKAGTNGLDAGEYAVIQLYCTGLGAFVITDDGQAARYCRREGIPFINALLFPVVLRFAHIKDEDFCRRSMENIIETGRYSEKIIAFARECSRESIAFALP